MRERQPMTQTVKASQAREQFSQLVNRVFRKETRVLVEKSGIPVAAIISAQDLERLRSFEEEREKDFKILEEFGAAFKDESPEEIERQVAKAVSEARAKSRKRTARSA